MDDGLSCWQLKDKLFNLVSTFKFPGRIRSEVQQVSICEGINKWMWLFFLLYSEELETPLNTIIT